MLRPRVIPVLLLSGESLVKTENFRRPVYVGDPCNTVRMFNELNVDELIVLDIDASRTNQRPQLALLAAIAEEAFMPMCYGGGIQSSSHAREVLQVGYEKVAVNTHSLRDPTLVPSLVQTLGSQAVVASIDVVGSGPSNWRLRGARRAIRDRSPISWAREVESMGAGEILLTSVAREGSWRGTDLQLTRQVSKAVTVPVIAHGGVGCIDDIERALKEGGASAVAVGSLVVFQGRGAGVVVNFPTNEELAGALALN